MKSIHDHHVSLKAFALFLIVALAFVLLFFYQANVENVYGDGNLMSFTALVVVGVLLLLGLTYLVSQPHKKATKSKSKKRK